MTDHNQIVRDYQRDGVVCIRRFLTSDQIAEIRDELDRYIREDLSSLPGDAKTLESDGTTVRNLWRLDQYNDYFARLAGHKETLDLVSQLVGGEAELCCVETFNKPAKVGSGVPSHQDNAYFCLTPPDVLTLWVAIDPVTIENGAVHFIKGSHKAGMLPTKPSGVLGNSVGLVDPPSVPKTDQFCATLDPGDATIHHCQTIHESDPNGSDRSRLGLLFVYRGKHTKTDDHLKAIYTAATT